MIDDFQHVSITCRDLERSIRFYERFGLKVTKRLGVVKTEGIAEAFQLARGQVAVAYLAPPHASGKMFIDLVQWLEPPSTGEAYPALKWESIASRFASRTSMRPRRPCGSGASPF
jgi:catechol 2,3-dioxygenase-like lactoylglutathione lyase family enzyme